MHVRNRGSHDGSQHGFCHIGIEVLYHTGAKDHKKTVAARFRCLAKSVVRVQYCGELDVQIKRKHQCLRLRKLRQIVLNMTASHMLVCFQ